MSRWLVWICGARTGSWSWGIRMLKECVCVCVCVPCLCLEGWSDWVRRPESGRTAVWRCACFSQIARRLVGCFFWLFRPCFCLVRHWELVRCGNRGGTTPRAYLPLCILSLLLFSRGGGCFMEPFWFVFSPSSSQKQKHVVTKKHAWYNSRPRLQDRCLYLGSLVDFWGMKSSCCFFTLDFSISPVRISHVCSTTSTQNFMTKKALSKYHVLHALVHLCK